MNDNILVDKSFKFAVRVVKLYKYICDDKKEYILSKQLLRSGTSIGANINEAQEADSIIEDLIEILKLLTSIIKSTKNNLKENNAK